MPLTQNIPLGEISFTENGRHTKELNRVGDLAQIGLRLRFTVTNSATGPVGPLWHALSRLVKRFEIDVQGQDTPVRIDGPGMVERAMRDFTVFPTGSQDTVVLTNSAVTAYDVFLPIQLTLPRSANPYYTALPLRRFTQVNVAITWGDIDDLFTTPNAAAISLVSAELYGKFMVGTSPDIPYRARVLDMITKEVNSSSDNFVVSVDGNTGQMHRTHMIQALVGNIADNDMLSAGSIRLKTGEHTFHKWDAPILQSDNAHDYEQSSVRAGGYFVNLEENGQPLWIDTSRNSMTADLDYEFDVTKQAGTNKFVIYSEKIRGFDVGG